MNTKPNVKTKLINKWRRFGAVPYQKQFSKIRGPPKQKCSGDLLGEDNGFQAQKADAAEWRCTDDYFIVCEGLQHPGFPTKGVNDDCDKQINAERHVAEKVV